MGDLTLGLAFIAGLLSFISPCVLPLVPAYIGYMGGRMTHNVALQMDGGKAKADMTAAVGARFQMVLHGAAFVMGFTIVFVLFGLMTTAFVSVVGSAVTVLTDIIGRVGGIIIIFFGLHFMGILPNIFKWIRQQEQTLNNLIVTVLVGGAISGVILWGFIEPVIALPIIAAFWLALVMGGAFNAPGAFWMKLLNTIENALYTDTRRDMEASKTQGLGGSFFMGVVFSAGWTPCIGPLLGAILTLAANTGDVGVAVPMLTAYSLGLGIPFMLTAGLLEGAQGILRKLQRHMRKIELASGALLVFIGVMVASGQIQSLSANLNTQFADFSFRVEECGVGFFSGEIGGQHLGNCVDGSLVPVAIGQSASSTLTADTPQAAYLFHVDEATAIDVEINRLEADVTTIVRITDNDGAEITRAEGGVWVDDLLLPIMDFSLPEAGTYLVTVGVADALSTEQEVGFRLKVVEAEAREAAAAIDTVGTISDFAAASGPAEGLAVGNRAPDFEIVTMDGESVVLSDLQGQVVLLNFWGTWCGPCRREMPEFQSVYEEHAEEGFTILALAVRGDTEESVAEFRDEFGLTFPLAVDEGDVINDLYGIQTQPSSFLIGADGVIQARHFGMLTETQIVELVEDAVSES